MTQWRSKELSTIIRKTRCLHTYTHTHSHTHMYRRTYLILSFSTMAVRTNRDCCRDQVENALHDTSSRSGGPVCVGVGRVRWGEGKGEGKVWVGGRGGRGWNGEGVCRGVYAMWRV